VREARQARESEEASDHWNTRRQQS
jgi:hypothetical protein